VIITASGIGVESIRKDMGDVELVAKPYSSQSLVQAIGRALASRASE